MSQQPWATNTSRSEDAVAMDHRSEFTGTGTTGTVTTSPDEIPTLGEDQSQFESSTQGGSVGTRQGRAQIREPKYKARTSAISTEQVFRSRKEREEDSRRVVPEEASNVQLEDYEQWPVKPPKPAIADRLGSSVLVKASRIPNARYKFQWTPAKIMGPAWKKAKESEELDEPVYLIENLSYDKKYDVRVVIKDTDGEQPTLTSPYVAVITHTHEKENYILRERYERKNRALEEELSEVYDSNEYMHQVNNELGEERNALERQIAELQREVEQLRTRGPETTGTDKDKTQLERQLEEMRAEKESYENQYKKLLDQVNRSSRSTQEKEEEINLISAERDKLSRQIEEEKQHSKELEQKCKRQEREIYQLCRSMEQRMQGFQKELDEKEKSSKQNTEAMEQLEQLRAQFYEQEQELQQIRQERDRLAKDLEHFQGMDVDRLKTEHDAALSQKKELEEEIASYKADYEKLLDQYNNICDDVKRLRKTITEKDNTSSNLSYENSNLKERCTTQEQDIRYLEDRVDEKDKRIEELLQERRDNIEKLNQRKEDLENVKQEMMEKEEKFQWQADELELLRRNLADKDSRLSETISKRDYYHDKVYHLEEKVSLLHKSLQEKDERLKESVPERSNLLGRQEEEIKRLNKELKKKKRQLRQVTFDKENLDDKVRRLEKELNRLHRSYEPPVLNNHVDHPYLENLENGSISDTD